MFCGSLERLKRIASRLVVEQNCRLERLKRIVVKVFLLPGSAYVSPRRPACCAVLAHTTSTKPLIWSCQLLISRLFELRQTRLPHVRLWTELRGFCRVPHHGASLPSKRSAQVPKTVTSTPSLPGCKSPLPFIGFILSECVSECVAPIR